MYGQARASPSSGSLERESLRIVLKVMGFSGDPGAPGRDAFAYFPRRSLSHKIASGSKSPPAEEIDVVANDSDV